MDSTVTFDPVTRVIGFSVKVAGRDVPCRVTEDWLRDTYGPAALQEGALKAFTRRRAAIDTLVLRHWLASRGAEPVWLKREHVWRQPASKTGEKRAPEKYTT